MDTQLNTVPLSRVPKMGQDTFTGSVLNVEVSCYPCYYINDETPPPTTVNLLTFLQSQKHRGKVEEIRRIDDKERRDKLKALLPAITPSGIFNENRTDKGLIQHSGLLQFDIDLKGNEHITNYAQLKEQICKVKNVAYCGLSVSGKGFWGLVPIAHPEKHRQHFKALKKKFEGVGITIDTQCINVARLRGYSFDPDAYYNHHATTFYPFEEREPVKRTYASTPDTDDAQIVELYLQEIERSSTDITGGYGEWWEIGCAFATAFGENGRGYFHRVSQYHPDYSHAATDRKYDECLKGYDFKLGTFFYYCKLANFTIQLPKRERQPVQVEERLKRKIEPLPVCPTPEAPKVYELQLTDIIEPMGYTTYPQYENLVTEGFKLRDGQIVQILYHKGAEEPITHHSKATALARDFKKTFIPGRIHGIEGRANGVDCLLNIATH